jgi:hypothetical protein
MTQTYNGINGNSVLPASGYYGASWPSESALVLPAGHSVGGWTIQNRGFVQQTFLGASIRNFSMNGGFGDSSSTLSVELINDEFNRSDATAIGNGDDVYHNGQYDFFAPPIAGSPVFFKFGQNHATVEQAFRKTLDTTYGFNTLFGSRFPFINPPNPNFVFNRQLITNVGQGLFFDISNGTTYNLSSYLNPTNMFRGEEHIVFGGILQSYLQNRGPGGNPLYSVQVTDPREILSNVTVILNNYAGSTFATKNIFNVFGFLEHNPTPKTSGELQSFFGNQNILQKIVNTSNGFVSYVGSLSDQPNFPLDCYVSSDQGFGKQNAPQFFPVTGTGFSRRSPQGIPWYRIEQALNSLMSTQYPLPTEYQNMGFGSVINFRGYNYVIDFSGLPKMPPLYYLDFDQINILDLCMEICDVTSRELFVSLLPIINHPAYQYLYNWNQSNINDPTKLIAGVIRIDSIDKSITPRYGAIKQYIDNLYNKGILVENQDVGYELSNVVTDKFIVGAQEVDMYCFSGNADRDIISVKRRRAGSADEISSLDQWLLEKQLEQQIIPYYGLLGNNAVTIPKGWGAYQQILLDATGLNVNGVGAYYVATEMELRYAAIGYKEWRDFLLTYNDLYMESIEDDDVLEGAAYAATPNINGDPAVKISSDFAVTVPRSVFDTYAIKPFEKDGLPSSPCNPPYGYPLYYKRATKIGIPEGGFTKIQGRISGMIQAAATFAGADGDNYEEVRNTILNELDVIRQEYGFMTKAEQRYYNEIRKALNKKPPNIDLLNSLTEGLHRISSTLPKLAQKGTDNALKVYNFVKKIADENLGKKFLVKIPQEPNLFYENIIKWKGNPNNGEYGVGPFGFKPRPANSIPGYEFTTEFTNQIKSKRSGVNMIKSFLSYDTNYGDNPTEFLGGLKVNYNSMIDQYEFNYTPSNLGGYFPFDLYTNTLSFKDIQKIPENNRPIGVLQGLIPQDVTNFINEEGRLSAYVKFDNSQVLDMSQLNTEDFIQQLITPNGMVPDLSEFLDNTGDENISFQSANADNLDQKERKSKSIAFVKCSIDEKFYMSPKINQRSITVYGDAVSVDQVSRPAKIFVQCSGLSSTGSLIPGTGVYIESFKINKPTFRPSKKSIGTTSRYDFNRYFEPVLNSNIIDTNIQNLDTNSVYVLISLPNKLIPTKEARFRDANNQAKYNVDIKHYLSMDVVKGLPEFNTPAYVKNTGKKRTTQLSPRLFSAETRSNAWLAAKAAEKSLKYGGPMIMQQIAPSPVYPDLVVIPLISKDRCYGPWISSQVDIQGQSYINIGGRIEFSKDENLAPWNFAGYELMNEAGVLQASFTNNLLLFSERGGFSFPGLPDVSLSQSLLQGGPLVTNISVDVGDNGVKTTYKMDLYTSSFGKLQKQKQDLISKISRERQKLRDEKNNLIRKGFGKGQTSTNMVGALNNIASIGGNFQVSLGTQKNNISHIVTSTSQYETEGFSNTLNTGSQGMFGSSSHQLNIIENVNDAAFESLEELNDMTNQFTDTLSRETASKTAAATPINEMYTSYSEEPYNDSIPNKQYSDYNAINKLYGVDNKDITNPN